MTDPAAPPPSGERQQLLKQLFLHAIELSPAALDGFLRAQQKRDPELAAELEALLASDHAVRAGERPPRLGAFEIIETIGEGGMGVVYLARQASPVCRLVALKVIRAEMASAENVARFISERQALALMTHPYIARVFDAGATPDGELYIAMEFIPGLPINAYCDHHKLDLDARLELFAGVCDAVQHAHQKGVIHRDLKPSNILVMSVDGRPVPKIIDFGVARAIGSSRASGTPPEPSSSPLDTPASQAATRAGTILGTPEYMSPEQAGMEPLDIDTRTDVYALGVILYELLTGDLPPQPLLNDHDHDHDRGNAGAAPRRSHTALPPSPSSRSTTRRIRADLDHITLKALRGDRRQRYSTASELAADLRRYLAHEPVLATPSTPAYRLRLALRRQRGLIIAVGAVITALTVGLGISFRLYLQADRAQQRSQELLGAYRNLADLFLIQTYQTEADSLWPAWPERIPAMRAWVDKANALAARLDYHVDNLHHLEQSAPTASRGADRERRWLRSKLQVLVSQLQQFADPDPERGAIAAMRARIDSSAAVATASLARAALPWADAIAAISDSTTCPAYHGLQIVPQIGLIPLGADPESGLWEFALYGSGTIPERSAAGDKLEISGASAVVLVLLPGGTFNMGAVVPSTPAASRLPNRDPQAWRAEGPIHRVTLAPFFISKYELTRGQWQRLLRRVTSPNRALTTAASLGSAGPFTTPSPASYSAISDPERLPVEPVAWETGRVLLQRSGLCLPTEAQWEYACRAGSASPWFSGWEAESLRGYANLRDRSLQRLTLATTRSALAARTMRKRRGYEEWLDDGYPGLAPVGSFLPNAFGLYDVAGNVFEWCRDWFLPYTAAPRPGSGERLPTPDLDPPTLHIVRGGACTTLSAVARSSSRVYLPPLSLGEVSGLRPARALNPNAP